MAKVVIPIRKRVAFLEKAYARCDEAGETVEKKQMGWLTFWGMLWLVFCLVGCQGMGESDSMAAHGRPRPGLTGADEPEHLPLRQIRLRRAQDGLHVRVSFLVLPADFSLTEVLKAATPANAEMAPVLGRNGLRYDLLDFKDYPLFAKLLGKPLDVRRVNLTLLHDGTAVTITPPLRKPQIIQLYDVQQEDKLRVRRGQFRFLISSRLAHSGERLTVVPQLYYPKGSLRPRSMVEKTWDGRVFEALSTSLTLSSHQLLLISYVPRTTLAQWRADRGSGQGRGDSLFTPEPGEVAYEKHYPTLGQMLLMAERWRKPVQVLVVIGIRSA